MNGLELSVHASIKGLLITDVQQVFIMCFCICQVQAASTHFQERTTIDIDTTGPPSRCLVRLNIQICVTHYR